MLTWRLNGSICTTPIRISWPPPSPRPSLPPHPIVYMTHRRTERQDGRWWYMPDPQGDGIVLELHIRRCWSEELGVTSCLAASFFFRIDKGFCLQRRASPQTLSFFCLFFWREMDRKRNDMHRYIHSAEKLYADMMGLLHAHIHCKTHSHTYCIW